MEYKIKLTTIGNPDYGQDPSKPLYGVKPAMIKATTIEELRQKVSVWKEYNNVGGGNWPMPAVYLDGAVAGYMSYNGRVWDRDTWSEEAKEVILK